MFTWPRVGCDGSNAGREKRNGRAAADEVSMKTDLWRGSQRSQRHRLAHQLAAQRLSTDDVGLWDHSEHKMSGSVYVIGRNVKSSTVGQLHLGALGKLVSNNNTLTWSYLGVEQQRPIKIQAEEP
ncbi:hypothetical protein EYF80_007494 [Liparis tanakae]|uniref:Uncharacterized protein n=1 Tax=Liparis tanakae TaxID=230148 RepID=A0A4Z2IYW3_9TELE|nr:hypothetical protein EYF80_007494 [Liparis tanakae]